MLKMQFFLNPRKTRIIILCTFVLPAFSVSIVSLRRSGIKKKTGKKRGQKENVIVDAVVTKTSVSEMNPRKSRPSVEKPVSCKLPFSRDITVFYYVD